jgi:GDPmannose 4,6-dehydratase
LSFEIPESTCDLTALGTLRILEILRDQPAPPRFVHASSREIFGTPIEFPQTESTPMNPNSPYGVAKAFATQMVKIYREAHGLFFCNAICYNHESPRRSENFVTRKISLAAAGIHLGLQRELVLGNIDSARDWGFAAEYVEAMWRMLQQPTPSDYILASGRSHTVREFLELAFRHVGLDWHQYYRLDPRFARPVDAANLLGDPTRARELLGWTAQTSLADLAKLMVDHDLDKLGRGR